MSRCSWQYDRRVDCDWGHVGRGWRDQDSKNGGESRWDHGERCSWRDGGGNGRHCEDWKSKSDSWSSSKHDARPQNGKRSDSSYSRGRAQHKNGRWSGGSEDAWDEGSRSAPSGCGDAKLRLVRERRRMRKDSVEALATALKRKRDEAEGPLVDLPLSKEVLEDVRTVWEQDLWDEGSGPYRCGVDWLKEWLANGEDWARLLEEPEPEGPHTCRLCWKAFKSEAELQRHVGDKAHRKKQRNWRWRYGDSDPLVLLPAAPPAEHRAPADVGAAASAGSEAASRGEFMKKGASKAAAEMLYKAQQIRESPVAQAKRRLLEFRDKLSVAQRKELLASIGTPRARDVVGLEQLRPLFGQEGASELHESARLVTDQNRGDEWLWKEPTFSWLSGFHWHPGATSVDQQGTRHGPFFCHLCEADGWTQAEYDAHVVTRRHAENVLRWAETMGDSAYPSRCGRCPCSVESGRWRGGEDLDLSHYRAARSPAEPVAETDPPVGFRDVWRGDRGRVLATPWVAVVATVDRRACALRLTSTRHIGPKDKSAGRQKRYSIDFYWCDEGQVWRTLAIPMRDSSARPLPHGEPIDFYLAARWSEDEKEPFHDLKDTLRVEVPRPGDVAVLKFSEGGRSRGRLPDFRLRCSTSGEEKVPIPLPRRHFGPPGPPGGPSLPRLDSPRNPGHNAPQERPRGYRYRYLFVPPAPA